MSDIESKNTSPDGSDKKPYNVYAKYSGMVFQMAAIIFAGAYSGIWLDKHFENKTPYLTAGLVLLSVFLAVYFVIKDFIKK
jgi:putative effector of murein hydrolase LrgA (UPF0299 family)